MFEIGERVVCVDDGPRLRKILADGFPLKAGRIYVVGGVGIPPRIRGGGECITLVGLDWPQGFYASRFRPLDKDEEHVRRQAVIDKTLKPYLKQPERV